MTSNRSPKQILESVNRLKAAVDRGEREQARREGQLDTLYKELEMRFGVAGLEEAKQKLTEMQEREEKTRTRLNAKLDELETMLESHGQV